MDVAFILDFSGSIDVIYGSVLAFAEEVIYGLPIGFDRARVAMLHLSDTADIDFYLDTYQTRQEVLNALSFQTSGGATNTQDAIRMMYEEVFVNNRGDRNGVDNICIIVTDGKSNIQESKVSWWIAEQGFVLEYGVTLWLGMVPYDLNQNPSA